MRTTNLTIEQQLQATWRRERRFCHVRGICRCVIWLGLLLLLGLIIDWGLLFKTRMPAAYSVALGVVGLVTMVWVVWRDWLRHLRPYNAKRIALEVEARYPELMSSLVSYTELDAMARQSQASPELLEAMRDFAVQKSQQLKFRDIIDVSQVIKLAAYAAIVLLVAAGVSVRWSDHIAALVQRLAGFDAPYPIRTELIEINGDMEGDGNLVVPFGNTADITVKAGGVIPDDAILYVKPAEGESQDWTELPMEKLDNGFSFRGELESLERDMNYFVTMGDYRSKTFDITVVRAPRIVKAELRLQLLPYLNPLERPPETTDQLNLEVPEGTEIHWYLQCDKAVENLTVRHGDQSLDAEVGESGRDVSFSIIADRRFTYTFTWTVGASDEDSHVEDSDKEGFTFEDVEYSVRVNKDAIPRITFAGRAPSGPATVGKKAAIRWRAQDDHGLDKIWLVYSVTTPGDPEPPQEQRVQLPDVEGRVVDEDSYIWTPAKDIPGLSPGQQISYHLEATDLKDDEPGERLARSPVRQLSIVSNDDYMDWFRRQLAQRNEVVKQTFLLERDASKRIKQLLAEEGENSDE